jgi:hypothetical protein
MNWIKKLLYQKVLAYVIFMVNKKIDSVDNKDIDKVDTFIDGYIKRYIKEEWAEGLVLDIEQAMIDNIIKEFLPDIKKYIKKHIKSIAKNQGNSALLIRKMHKEG